MLPTGHIAAGFLTAQSVIKIFKPELDPHQLNQLFMTGALFGFAPDLDEFWFFFKNKSLLVAPKTERYHRTYISHAPVLWLMASLLVILFASGTYWRLIGLTVWLASWSHFFFDSIEYGIMWLWPFSSKLYAIKEAGHRPFVIEDRNFFRHSFKFLWAYTKTWTFYFEVLIILTAIIIFVRG